MSNDKLIIGLFSLAWGYILIHININILIFDMLPDWLGYCLFLKGISSLSFYESSAKLLRPLGILLIVYSIGEEFAKINQLAIPVNIITLIVTIIGLYFHFQLLTNVADIANRCELGIGDKILFLRTARTVLVTIFTLSYSLFDNYYLFMALGVINVILGISIASSLFRLRRSPSFREASI